MYISKQYNKNISKLALLIGINYGNSRHNELHGAISDANNLASLCRLHGYDTNVLVEERATKVAILANLETLVEKSYQTDRIFISFSGHGSNARDTTTVHREELDGLDECIISYDNEQITDDEIKNILLKFSPFCKVLFLMDACHSGTGIDLPIRYITEDCIYVENRVAPLADILFISGCKDEQTSSDMRDEDGMGYGLFTSSFLNNYNQFHNVFSMMDQIKKECKKISQQTPQMSSSRLIKPDTKITDYLY